MNRLQLPVRIAIPISTKTLLNFRTAMMLLTWTKYGRKLFGYLNVLDWLILQNPFSIVLSVLWSGNSHVQFSLFIGTFYPGIIKCHVARHLFIATNFSGNLCKGFRYWIYVKFNPKVHVFFYWQNNLMHSMGLISHQVFKTVGSHGLKKVRPAVKTSKNGNSLLLFYWFTGTFYPGIIKCHIARHLFIGANFRGNWFNGA